MGFERSILREMLEPLLEAVEVVVGVVLKATVLMNGPWEQFCQQKKQSEGIALVDLSVSCKVLRR